MSNQVCRTTRSIDLQRNKGCPFAALKYIRCNDAIFVVKQNVCRFLGLVLRDQGTRSKSSIPATDLCLTTTFTYTDITIGYMLHQ